MINQELLLLGILKDGPKHGYEIKKKIKEVINNLALSPISSIYYPLKVLAQKNYLSKKKEQAGNRPEKYTYSLTDKGEKRFLELLEHSLLTVKKPHFDIDVSLYFLPYIDPKVAIRRLRARKAFLERIKEGVVKILQTQSTSIQLHTKAILEHNLALVQAEIDFLSTITQAVRKEAPHS